MKKLIATLLLIALPAQAELQHIPKWKMVGDYACYDFEQAKQLLELDARMVLWEEQNKKLTEAMAKLALANDDLKGALETSKAEAVAWKGEADDLRGGYKTCIADKNKCQTSGMSAVAWIITGATVIVATGFVIGFAVAKN